LLKTNKALKLTIFEKNAMPKFTCVFLLFWSSSFGQEPVANDSVRKTNPIVFVESTSGFGGSNGGFVGFLGLNLNYQFNRTDLITTRFTALSGGTLGTALISPVTPLPIFIDRQKQYEFAALYGKRWTFSNCSLGVSTGIAHLQSTYFQDIENNFKKFETSSIGIPFEFNIKFFKAQKQRFRAYYGLIPIGTKKVSFGRSVGFKLMGHFSKNNWMGFGFTYGFGWHKKY